MTSTQGEFRERLSILRAFKNQLMQIRGVGDPLGHAVHHLTMIYSQHLYARSST